MSRFKRTLALAVSGFLVAAAISMSVASPAQASAADCIGYLENVDYRIDTAIEDACDRGGALGGVKGTDYCKGRLKARGGIASIHANTACARAVA